MFQNSAFTSISELGEFGLIQHLTAAIQLYDNGTLLGVGDDAAIVSIPEGQRLLLTTDLLLEGVHFDPIYTPLRHLGYKAIVVNLSDIAAMNAKPAQVTVSLGISSRYTLDAVEELYAGMLLACERYKVDLVGGDTTSSHKGLVISVTATGFAEEQHIVRRSGAKVGDLICVSGDLGSAFLGLQILEREKRVFLENPQAQPDLEEFEYMVGRQLKPEARFDILDKLRKLGIQPNAMMDISDGLSSELLHIANQSKVGLRLYEEKIPIDPKTYDVALDFNIDPTVAALSGGEDYELVFTVPQTAYEQLKGDWEITVVGHVTEAEAGCRLVSKSGNEHELTAQGWNSLLKKDS